MLEKIGLPAKPATRGSSWVVDASHCQGCSSQFTFINRKHHCRRCGGLFCNSCTQQRMVLRGQGDSPVRICEPCKKLEEAARFQMRHGHKNRAGRAGSKLESAKEDDIIKQILGSDKKESVSSRESSNTCTDSRLQRDATSASCSNIKEVTTAADEKESPRNLSVEQSSPEELRQQALDEKKKYKILKGEGKSEDALNAFKRGKELERQAAALELSLRKNRKRALSLSSTNETQKNNESGRKSEKNKEKDDLASELRELGWSDKDLHDSDMNPAISNLEGGKSNTEAGSHGIDKSQILALKKKALMLKREGKLGEAKEELKKAKVLEKKLEEEEFLGEAEDFDCDNFSDGYTQDTGFDLGHLLCNPDDLGVDSNFEVTAEDMDDPEMDAALKMLGWTNEETKAPQVNVSNRNTIPDLEDDNTVEIPFKPTSLPSRRSKSEIQRELLGLKRKALAFRRQGDNDRAEEVLEMAKALEEEEEAQLEEMRVTQSEIPNPVDYEALIRIRDTDTEKSPEFVDQSTIRQEILILKRNAVALKRDGKTEKAKEELNKAKHLEDGNALPAINSGPVSISTENIITKEDFGSSNLCLKPPVSSRDRFKLQQESLTHKRLALKLRREGRTVEAEAEFELAKALETQLEDLGSGDSVKSSTSGANTAEDFLDPQLFSALKAVGFDDAKPIKSVATIVENSGQERMKLEEQIRAEKTKAVSLKRAGMQTEALDALRRAKVLEKKMISFAS